MRPVVTAVSQPAAGSDWQIVPSTGEWAQVSAITARLVTSATVANRIAHFKCLFPDDLLAFDAVPEMTLAAGASGVYSLARWQASFTGGQQGYDNTVAAPLPSLWLLPGSIIETDTTGIQAGDQWSDVVLAVVLHPNPWGYEHALAFAGGGLAAPVSG